MSFLSCSPVFALTFVVLGSTFGATKFYTSGVCDGFVEKTKYLRSLLTSWAVSFARLSQYRGTASASHCLVNITIFYSLLTIVLFRSTAVIVSPRRRRFMTLSRSTSNFIRTTGTTISATRLTTSAHSSSSGEHAASSSGIVSSLRA